MSISPADFKSQKRLTSLNLNYKTGYGNYHIGSSVNPGNTAQLSFNAAVLNLSIYSAGYATNYSLSDQIHDQKDSNLCWSFSLSSLIVSEIIRYLNLTNQTSNLKLVESLNCDNRLQREIVTLAVPRSPKLTQIDQISAQVQTAYLPSAIEKICYPSLLAVEATGSET